MEILYHHRTQGRGAEGVHVMAIVKGFEGLGHTVTLLSPPGVNPREEAGQYLYTRSSGVIKTLWRLFSRYAPQAFFELGELLYNLGAFVRLWRVGRGRPIGLMYERYAFSLFAGALFARWRQLPLVLEVNEVSGLKRARKQVLVRLAGWIERKVCASADRVVVVSSFLKAHLVRQGIAPDKIIVLPNGVDTELFYPDRLSDAVRARYRLDGKTVLGFAGWIDSWDALPFLLDVFGEVHSARPQASLMLIGGGPSLEALRQAAASLPWRDAVVLTGGVERSQMPAHIAALDIGIIPHSNPFGSPVVLFEFMASAKPVVATRLGPLEDVIRHADNGLLFPPMDRTALKETLIHLIDDPALRARIGANARDTVLQHHTWDAKVRAILTSLQASGRLPHAQWQPTPGPAQRA